MGVAIGVGLMECPFGDAAGYWRWIDMCESGGVDSIWQTDRIVGPPPMLECMALMGALAGRTKRLRFGMNVLSLAHRDPVLVAKQCATVDFLSHGRMLPAFGIGSPRAPEWQVLGYDTRTRGAKTDEALDIITRLWAQDEVTYDGRHFQLKGATIMPKPVQSELPMWIGGSSEAAIRRTARIGTGWISGPETPAEIAPIVERIRAAVIEAGRSIDHDHYGAGLPFYFGQPTADHLAAPMAAYHARTGNDPLDYFAVGDGDDIVKRLGEFGRAGISKFILRPTGRDGGEVLEQTGRLIDEILPRVTELQRLVPEN